MASKNLYYVLVFTEDGPKFVTGCEKKVAIWDTAKDPKEFTKAYAEDLRDGLRWNGTNAVVVTDPVGVCQPYCYSRGHFEWKWNGDN